MNTIKTYKGKVIDYIHNGVKIKASESVSLKSGKYTKIIRDKDNNVLFSKIVGRA